MTVLLFPGQGSQQTGMGDELFTKYPDLTATADDILGYSIATLCMEDPDNQLGLTQFTQPALYVVEALGFLAYCEEHPQPSTVAGHSLGEYSALFAAGAFDFATGINLVKKRGM